jgi:hypothetical protein
VISLYHAPTVPTTVTQDRRVAEDNNAASVVPMSSETEVVTVAAAVADAAADADAADQAAMTAAGLAVMMTVMMTRLVIEEKALLLRMLSSIVLFVLQTQ